MAFANLIQLAAVTVVRAEAGVALPEAIQVEAELLFALLIVNASTTAAAT